MALRKPKRRPTPSNWASLKPLGIGEQRPNNYREVFRAARENRDEERHDSLNGAAREAVLMSAGDAERHGLADGDAVLVRSAAGEMRGRALIVPIAPGNVQVHWPEGNVLIADGVRSPESKVPDYNARVSLEALA